ncbi:unnamed protein product, partial [Iphiclides podalirius]
MGGRSIARATPALDALGNRRRGYASRRVDRRAPTPLSIVGNDARGDPNRASVIPSSAPALTAPPLRPDTTHHRGEFSYQLLY